MAGVELSEDGVFDVIVVGAGISGINSGYRLQDQIKDVKYTILESRGGIGGTWDFFKYPGIRSDSDLHTFGFPWRPWQEQNAIADGESIVNYVRETAAMFGIDKHVRYYHKMLSASWSSEIQKWRLEVEVGNSLGGEATKIKQFYANFLFLSTGYYDYETPLQTTINGLENFKGTVVHPQFWPEDLDYADKRLVIIGSGATSVTLLPVLARTAEHVTMLQRSPGYLMNMPQTDSAQWICNALGFPNWLTFKIVRLKFLILPFLFFNFCRTFPNAARFIMGRLTKAQLPKNVPFDPHFIPTYNPWEQRLCVAPDGDFYEGLRNGKADIATGKIKTMTADTIVLESGQELKTDIIITATGLKMRFAGGAKLSVDGETMDLGKKFMWKGVMIQDLPNAAFVLGYTNASWTLGADATAQHVCRLINTMKKNGQTSVRPIVKPEDNLEERPILNLQSTYVMKAASVLPRAADKKPFKARSNYFTDLWEARYGELGAGLEFESKEVENGFAH